VIAPSLLKGVEFDTKGQAARWHPFEHDTPLVVLDPLRQFGQPITGDQPRAAVAARKRQGRG